MGKWSPKSARSLSSDWIDIAIQKQKNKKTILESSKHSKF